MGTNPLSLKNEGQGCYVWVALVACVWVIIVEAINPNIIPFDFWQFWKLDATLGEVLQSAWLLFAWGLITTFLLRPFRKDLSEKSAIETLTVGFLKSLWAGIVEEISFRWLIFYSAIVGWLISDLILLGFLGLHPVQWFFEQLALPVANFFTLGALQEYLFNPLGWAVGAAIISANGQFRDGHAYQGLIGFVNSWFCGMFLFLLMFKYGLFAAMIVHFGFDMLLFTLDALFIVLQSKRRSVATGGLYTS